MLIAGPNRRFPIDVALAGFLGFSRVPRPLRAKAKGCISKLPTSLLGTGFNPSVMAPVHKPVA